MEHWRERLAMAEELLAAARSGTLPPDSDAIEELLLRLAADDKWEVRQAVARGLGLIDHPAGEEIAQRLSEDGNAFVCGAAKLSSDRLRARRRQQQAQEARQRRMRRRREELRSAGGEDAVRLALADSDARFSHLAAGLVHDAQSILGYIKPPATRMQHLATDPALRRQADRILDGVEHLQQCVLDVAAYSGPVPLDLAPEDLSEVLADACEIARRSVESEGLDPADVTLRLRVPKSLPARLSRPAIVLAVVNLVKNAYESFLLGDGTLGAGEIDVEASGEGESLRIAIRDGGCGLAQEELEELMLLVPRRRNKRKPRSTGYGLPIAVRYVEAHGGIVAFESVRGVGTTVTLTLPRRSGRKSEEAA